MAIIREYTGNKIDASLATPEVELGSRRMYRDPVYGWGEFVYIHNADVIDLTPGGIVQHKTASAPFEGISCVTAKFLRYTVLGVCQTTIKTLQYGWVQTGGSGRCRGDGNVTKDLPVMSEGTTGRAKLATITNLDESLAVIGTSLTDDGAADSLFSLMIKVDY